MGIFDYNGSLMDALRKFSDIVMYNIIFCVFSLPIITAGAAMYALCEGMQLVAAEEEIEGGVFRSFFVSFKRNFKRGTGLWLAFLAVVFVLAGLGFAIQFMPAGMKGLYTITLFVLIFFVLIGYQYYFPLAVMYEDWDVKKIVKNAFLWVLAALPQTFAMIVVTSVFVYVTLILNMNAFRFGIFVWASCGFGIVTYVNALFFLKIQKKISGIEEQAGKDLY